MPESPADKALFDQSTTRMPLNGITVLDLTLARQAQTLPQQPHAARACPSCQQPLACADANPRRVQTRVGEAQGSEPQGYCPRCRRAFFPSEPESGD